MKKLIMSAVVLCSLAANAQGKNTGTERADFKAMSYGTYTAKADSHRMYSISDPVTRALMYGTNGADINKNSEIAGVSKRAYGFAHGHIMLRSSGSATSGTMHGSGSVGTGSTPGSAGTHGAGIGVNGKAPYAGPGIWGTAVTGKGIRIHDEPVRSKE